MCASLHLTKMDMTGIVELIFFIEVKDMKKKTAFYVFTDSGHKIIFRISKCANTLEKVRTSFQYCS
jgi:hypothetical protein